MQEQFKILAIVQEYVTDLQNQGEDWVGTCPSCSRQVLSISSKYCLFYCFGCGAGGGTQELIRLITFSVGDNNNRQF